MKVTFYPRGKFVQARISDGTKVNYRLSTGIKVRTEHKFVKGKFVGNTPEIQLLNTELERHRFVLSDLYTKYRDLERIKKHYNFESVVEDKSLDEGNYDLIDLLREYVRMMRSGEMKKQNGMKFSDSSFRAYDNSVYHITGYSQIVGSIDLSKFMFTDHASMRKAKARFDDYFKGFDNYLIDLQFVQTTRSNIFNNIVIMLNHWQRELCITLPKITFVPVCENPILALPSDFVSKFVNDSHKIYSTLNKHLKYTWEVCATILITSLRVNDALSLSFKDFHREGDKLYLMKFNKKTGAMTHIPLPEKIRKVYDDNLAYNSDIYSMKGNSNMLYQNIPILFAMYEEMHDIVNVRSFGIHGEPLCETKPWYKAVHPHLLRKTAITNMIASGIEDRFVKFASGHSPNSPVFERYVAFVNQRYNNQMEEYYKKL